MTGVGVVVFIASVLIAIGLHEFGHFATAKSFGIKVERFFIGFGPKLWSTKRGDTEYGVAVLPVGGYVRISGMNPLEEIPPEDRPRTFKAKPPWQRAVVLAAGSFTHFVVALLIIAGVLWTVGQLDFDHPTTTIDSVGSGAPGKKTPAEEAGIRPGDQVFGIDGVGVRTWQHAVDLIHDRPGKTLQIEVVRNGSPLTITVTLAAQKPDGTNVGFLGVSPRFAVIKRGPVQALGESVKQLGVGMKDSIVGFGKVFTPSTLGRLFATAAGNQERKIDDPTGLVGIGKVSGDLARSGDFAALFMMIAGFNIFVGVVNLLPLPPLDGGHLAVLGFETITRRDVDMRRLLPVTAMVLSIFATLFVLLLYLDIVRPIPIGPG